jgi:transketolase
VGQHHPLSRRRQPDGQAGGREADRQGVVYLRTTRGPTLVIYGPDEAFPIGGSRVIRSSDADEVTLIGAGVT